MKTKLFVMLALLVVTSQFTFAQLDRSKIPPPGPAPSVSFPDYDLVTTANGMKIIIVIDNELPTVAIRLLIDRKPHLEKEYIGSISLMGQLLRNGTKTRTKDKLDEEIDLIGARINSYSTSIFASGLSKYTEKLFELTSDIILNPSFSQDELDKVKEQTISGLKYRKTEPDAIVEVLRQRAVYGANHPYGEFETEESVGKITRERCLEMYNTFFKPNYAIMAIVGDIDKKKILNLIDKYFGSWKKGKIPKPKFKTPKMPERINIALVDRSSSVQSVIRVAQVVDIKRTSPDVIPVKVMNTVLGGGIFRLFTNLREKHSYTYGAYSSMGPDELIGNFTASTSVRNVVTDSALEQIFYEINRIRDEKVEAKELQMAKNYISGSFVQSLENAETIANYAIEIERYKLPKDYYKTYLKRVYAVTPDNVMKVAKQYLKPDKMTIALVGTAKEIKEKISKFGPITMYDEDANLIVEKPISEIAITSDELFVKFIEKSGGKEKLNSVKDRTIELSGKVQNFDIKAKTINKAPNKLYVEIDFGGMFKQKIGFDGEKGWTVSPQGTMDLEGSELIDLKVQALINFYEQYKDLGITAKVAGIKNIKGKDYYEVVFEADTSSKWTEYFGKDDFLKFRQIKIAEGPTGKVEQTTDYLDYKDFNGFLFPSKQVQSVMGQLIDLKVDKFEVNTGVDDSIFVKPSK
ncbi:MAG: insulinase family protein [Bacteroidetes bacterium]|nr:insulinase family protein [Bacteroidota bacterium]MBU2585541.1 insulinase family protein [Bacteroidota bacterium]